MAHLADPGLTSSAVRMLRYASAQGTDRGRHDDGCFTLCLHRGGTDHRHRGPQRPRFAPDAGPYDGVSRTPPGGRARVVGPRGTQRWLSGRYADGTYATMFASASWSLPGPHLQVLGQDDITVAFVTENLLDGNAIVRLVLTRADGSVFQGGRVSTPTGFGLPIAETSPPGYYFRPDPGASTTFTFLVGNVEHSVEVAGHPLILSEGPPGGWRGDGERGVAGCAAVAGTPTVRSHWTSIIMAVVVLASLVRRHARRTR